MKVGDLTFAEHFNAPGGFFVGVIIGINITSVDYRQYRVLWNDGDQTWEDDTTILTETQKEEVQKNESR